MSDSKSSDPWTPAKKMTAIALGLLALGAIGLPTFSDGLVHFVSNLSNSMNMFGNAYYINQPLWHGLFTIILIVAAVIAYIFSPEKPAEKPKEEKPADKH